MSLDDERWREFQKQYQQDMMQQRAVERAEAIERATKQARAELRDRFAMAALTGLLADPSVRDRNFDLLALNAYEVADAMLLRRRD